MSSKVITSAANAQFKLLKKLAGSSRERQKAGQSLLDGAHLINALAATAITPRLLVINEKQFINAEVQDCIQTYNQIPLIALQARLFREISPVESPTGILALIDVPKPEMRKYQFAILLEAIQDPGNLGSIMRTAAAAGVEAVFLSKECAEAWSPKALRGGMGAHFKLAIFEHVDLSDICRLYDNVIATQLGASQSLYEINPVGSTVWVFGNEGAGLSSELLSLATHRISIPMPGKMESLNVAAAVAVCLFDAVRKQNTSRNEQ